MYLAGFALTLVFVIARLVELMQENVNAEEEKEQLSERLKDIGDRAAPHVGVPETDITGAPEESSLRKRTGATVPSTKDD